MRYGMEFTLVVTDVESIQVLEEQLDEVMECLATLGMLDPFLDADFSTPDGVTVQIEFSLEADNDIDALAQASSSLRSAIHSVGGATPNWDEQWIVREHKFNRTLIEA